jgi:hypothetical protein
MEKKEEFSSPPRQRVLSPAPQPEPEEFELFLLTEEELRDRKVWRLHELRSAEIG